jgi:hypothetical protein
LRGKIKSISTAAGTVSCAADQHGNKARRRQTEQYSGELEGNILDDGEYLALAERREAVKGLEPNGRGGTENHAASHVT